MDEQATLALARIREQYGRHADGEVAEGNSDNLGHSTEGAGYPDPAPERTGGTPGTAGEHSGGVNSWLRRHRDQNGDDHPGASGGGQSLGGSDAVYSGASAPARTGASSGLKPSTPRLSDPSKPRGILATPSATEEAERAGVQIERPDDIVKVIRVTKTGKTQVRLRNGLFRWMDTPPGEVISTAEPAEPPLVNGFTGEAITAEGQPLTEIPVRNVPTGNGTKPKGIPIPVPGGTVKDGKWSGQNFAEAVKEHTPNILKVAKGVMSAREAAESRKDLADAIYEGFKVMDKTIQGTLQGHPQVQIWTNITDGELYTLADAWLGRAQRSAKDAERARRLIALKKQFQVGAILLPRFARTWTAYTNFGFEMPALGMARARRRR